MSISLIPVIVFVGVLTWIVGAYWIVVVVPESRGQSSLRRRLSWEEQMEASIRLLKKPEVLSDISSLDVLLQRVGRLSLPIKDLIDQADVPLNVGSFLLLSTTTCALLTVMAIFYARLWWVDLIAGAVGLIVPYIIVSQLRNRRVEKFEEQFPEAIDLIARAMRAGHAFSTGIKMASDELGDPTGAEFRLLFERQNYGAPMPDALKSFADRVPSLDARFFVTAVLTQREAGGNLAEVLDRLASVMRERFRIKREVRVRSAHGRITAFVLAGMPPVLAVITMWQSPEQFRLLITDPLGIKMLIGAAVLQILGTLIVRKLVDIEY